MVTSYTLRLTDAQRDLIEDLKDIYYGEVIDAEIDPETNDDPKNLCTITEPQRKLIELIDDGNTTFKSIKIQKGDPVVAIVPIQTKRCRFTAYKSYKLA